MSRGQLVEIGDGFRIPDILAESGATLVEVGTTNRTYLRDFEQAWTERTRAVLRVHTSNYRVVGFTAEPSPEELVGLAHARGAVVVDDLGSGALAPLPLFDDEPAARDSLAAGVDVVTFSGDKLLGGPQAGLVVGAREAVGAMRRHPLARAVRIDKLSLAALDALLRLYLDPERALAEVPTLAMLAAPLDEVRARAEALRDRLTEAGADGAALRGRRLGRPRRCRRAAGDRGRRASPSRSRRPTATPGGSPRGCAAASRPSSVAPTRVACCSTCARCATPSSTTWWRPSPPPWPDAARR